MRLSKLAAIIGPGILVAATGVGAGDLATGALTGTKLGVAILWAVVLGAGLKFVLNEGLARWQLATHTTLLEGATQHLGRPVQWIFLGYLLIWSFFVGSALMSACGIAAHALLPLGSADADKIGYGLAHSALAVLLIKLGGYRLFEKIMGVCIGIMFVTVLVTAFALRPDWSDVLHGTFVPTIPQFTGQGLQWTVALMGGVGGTVTVLCYGYWIREEGRHGVEDLQVCRIDLAVGYAATALFGMAMVVIGSTVKVDDAGSAKLLVDLGRQLDSAVHPAARWMFLVGAWGAVFSSLLGVWQSVPYLFADFWSLWKEPAGDLSARAAVDTRSRPYRFYLVAIATIPALGLAVNFAQLQKVYAITGALFIPMLALALLLLNGRADWLGGRQYRNSLWTTLLLAATLVLFLLAGWFEVINKLFPE